MKSNLPLLLTLVSLAQLGCKDGPEQMAENHFKFKIPERSSVIWFDDLQTGMLDNMYILGISNADNYKASLIMEDITLDGSRVMENNIKIESLPDPWRRALASSIKMVRVINDEDCWCIYSFRDENNKALWLIKENW